MALEGAEIGDVERFRSAKNQLKLMAHRLGEVSFLKKCFHKIVDAVDFHFDDLTFRSYFSDEFKPSNVLPPRWHSLIPEFMQTRKLPKFLEDLIQFEKEMKGESE